MALFQVGETRYVDTEHVADIEYKPASTGSIVVSPPDQSGGEPHTSHLKTVPSYLNIRLKSTEEMRFQHAEADAVWASFQKAVNGPGA